MSLPKILFLILISLTLSQDSTTYYMTMEKGAEPTIYSEHKLAYITVNIESVKNNSASELIFYLYPANTYNYIKAYLSFEIPQPSFDDSDYKIVSDPKPTFYLSKEEFKNINQFYICVECKDNCFFYYAGHGMTQFNLVERTKFDKYFKPGEILNARYNFRNIEKSVLFTALSPDSDSICFTAKSDNEEYTPKKILSNSYGIIINKPKCGYVDFAFKSCIENKGNYASISTVLIELNDYKEYYEKVEPFEHVITGIKCTVSDCRKLYTFNTFKNGNYSMRIETNSLELIVTLTHHKNPSHVLYQNTINQIGYLTWDLNQSSTYDLTFYLKEELRIKYDLIGIRFQISYDLELYDFQFRNMELFRNIPSRDTIPKGSINYYRVISRGDNSSPLEYHLRMIKGYPLLYYIKCDDYPNCQYNKEDLEQLIKEKKAITNQDVNNNIYIYITPEEGDFYHSKIQYLALVYCDETKIFSDDCEFQIEIDNTEGKGGNFVLFDNVITYDSLQKDENDYYKFDILDNSINKVYIVTYSFTGNVDLLPKFIGTGFSEPKHISYGNFEQYIFTKNLNEDINGYFNINVLGKENSFYSILYYTDKDDVSEIKSGEKVIQVLQDQFSKQFKFYNRNKNQNSPYLISINTLNCELKAIFNHKQEIEIKQYYQFILNSDQLDYKNDYYTVSLSISKYISVEPKEYDYCIFQISGNEVHNERALTLNEGYSHIETFSKNIKSLTYVYPYYLLKNDLMGKKEELYVSLLKNDKSKYFITYQINKGSTLESNFIDNSKYFKFSSDDLINECQNVLICPIKITINLKSEIEADNKPQIEFSFLSSHDIPKYMNKEIKYDGVTIDTKEKLYNSKYSYFYKDIKVLKENEYEYIYINFKRGHGSAVAKIVPKSVTEPNSNWNQRISLPIKDSQNLTYYIFFDDDNHLFKISKSDTQKCALYNCEIYIGVYNLDNENDIKLNEFSIYSQNYVNLKENELLSYYIDNNIKEINHSFSINKDSDVVYITFYSDMCKMKIKTKKGEVEIDWDINSSNELIEIKSKDPKLQLDNLKGLTFNLITTPENLSNQCKYSISYYIPEKNYPEVFNSKNNIATLGKFNNNNIVYFTIPVSVIDNTKNIAIYVNSNKKMSYDDIEIYVKKMNLDDYLNLDSQGIKNAMPKKGNCDSSSENQFSTDYLNIKENNVDKKDNIYLVTVQNINKIQTNSVISLLTKFGESIDKSKIKDEKFELIKINTNNNLTFDIGGNNKTYFVELGLIEGKILLENSERQIEKFNLSNEKVYGLFINPLKGERYILNNKNNEASLIYAKYTENIYKSNINKIAYNKKNIIRYNSKYSQIKFPISYYAPVDKEIIDLGYDIQLSIKVFQENKVNKTNDNFTLIGGLVDNEFINKVKYTEEEISQPEISSENIFNDGLREARFIFKNSIIKDNIDKKGIFFISIKNNNGDFYNDFITDVQILSINTKGDKLIIPNDNYYFLNVNLDLDKTILKLKKNEFSDSIMQIEFSSSFKDEISITINPQSDDIDYTKNKTNLIKSDYSKYGKSFIDLKIDDYSKIKFFEFALLPKKKNLLNKLNDNNTNYFVIKYQTGKNYNFTLPEEKLFFDWEKSTLNASRVMREKELVQDAVYDLNIYLQEKIKDREKLKSISSIEKPEYKLTTSELSERNISFKIDNNIVKDKKLYFVLSVTATYENNQEILIYDILNVENGKPVDPKDKEDSNKWLIWFIIIIVIVMVIGIFSYITFTEKLKNTDSNISEYNLNSVSGGLLDEKS